MLSKSIFKSKIGWLFLLPLIILLITLSVYPMISLIQSSFSTFITGKGYEYTGLKNAQKLWKDYRAWSSIGRTLLFVSVSVHTEFFIGLGLALIMKERYGSFLRTIFIIPMLVAPVAVGLIWRLMYNPTFGIINYVLNLMGFEGRAWLSNPALAMPSVIVVEVWQWTPFVFLILLAGLEALPPEPFEAAKVDGASSWQIFRYLTFPMLRPIIWIALLFRTMGCFKAFDKFMVLTRGGPTDETEIISLYVYKVAFRYNQLGYGAFLALVMVSIIVGYNLIYRNVLLKRE